MKNTILSFNSRVIPNFPSLFLGVLMENTRWHNECFPHFLCTAPSPGSHSEEKQVWVFRTGRSPAQVRKRVAGLRGQDLTTLSPL